MQEVDRRQSYELTPRDSVSGRLQAGCLRAVLFALIWWILTDGAMESWLLGVPVVLFATLVSLHLLPPFFWSITGTVQFIPFFIWHSLRGGIDVARRALHPQLPISPRLYEHQWRLPPGLPRVFMANTVSLLPGTLSAELDEEYLCVHVLDQNGTFASELKMIEARVASLFGLKFLADESEE